MALRAAFVVRALCGALVYAALLLAHPILGAAHRIAACGLLHVASSALRGVGGLAAPVALGPLPEPPDSADARMELSWDREESARAVVFSLRNLVYVPTALYLALALMFEARSRLSLARLALGVASIHVAFM